MDQTLAEAREVFYECYRFAAESTGLPSRTNAEVERYIGTPVPVAYPSLYPEADPSLSGAFVVAFQSRAEDVMVPLTTMLDGVPQALRALIAAGYKLAVLTQKLHRRSVAILERGGVLDCFAEVFGGDDIPALKPDPRGLWLAIERLGSSREDALFVGDTLIDAQTGENASVGFIGVLSGAYTRDEFLPHNPVAVLASVRDLPAHLGIR